jgi:hypothetical protein
MLVYTEYMINRVIPHLLTYPRSGSHYFDDMLYEEEKIHFTKSHYLDQLFDSDGNKRRTIITIARDPLDSISSYLAINDYRYSFEDEREFLIKEKIAEYVLMYSFLYYNADYFIDFNDLIKYPKPVIKRILGLLNIDKNTYNCFDESDIEKYKGFKPSSKSLSSYDRGMLDGFDLSLCYYYYYKLLENKIII